MPKLIGEFLVEKGVLRRADIEQILRHSQKTGLRFGDAGLELGILTRERMIQVFGPNFRVDFFQLEPAYFPTQTKDLFQAEEMIRHGAVALGFKTEGGFFRAKRKLNLGMLDPSNEKAARELEALARKKLPEGIAGVRRYLILADQFLGVMSAIYQIPDEKIRSLPAAQREPTLNLYLENFQR